MKKLDKKTKIYLISSILFLVGMIILLVIVTSVKNDISEEPTYVPKTEFLTYENSDEGFRINYPDDWLTTEDFMGMHVIFSAPPESDSDLFSESIGVVTEDLSDYPMSLDEYSDLTIEQLEGVITDIYIIDSSASTLDGYPAHKVVFTGRQGRDTLKWLEIWTIKDDKVYLIAYAAEIDEYSNYFGTIQEIINSFETI